MQIFALKRKTYRVLHKRYNFLQPSDASNEAYAMVSRVSACYLNVLRILPVQRHDSAVKLPLRVCKRVLILLYQQWLMNRHKTKLDNIFEVGIVYCERKTFSFST